MAYNQRTMQRPCGSMLLCFIAIIVVVGWSHWFLTWNTTQGENAMFRRRSLQLDKSQLADGFVLSDSNKAFASKSAAKTNKTTHPVRLKRSHVFKEKMVKFASKYRTDQTNVSQNGFLTGAKRIVGGTFLL
jgi:hypothetical protein